MHDPNRAQPDQQLTTVTLNDKAAKDPSATSKCSLEQLSGELRVNLLPSTHTGYSARFGSYELESIIGRGGMGIVLKGYDTTLHRVVALKFMAPQLATNPESRERFLREGRTAASINHPNVITVHAVGEVDGVPYLVMEYVAGISLHEMLRKYGPFAPYDAVRIASQIAAGLGAAHAHDLIHRDIKPANILVDKGGERVKIADFGLARIVLHPSDLTPDGHTVGTPSYMAPECLEGAPLDGRADLFSLGCVIYAMLTGSSPFQGPNLLAVVNSIMKTPTSPIVRAIPGIPRELRDLLVRLLKKNPNERPATADEVARCLSSIAPMCENSPVHLRSATRSRWRFPLRPRGLVVGLVVISLAIGGYILSRSHVSLEDAGRNPSHFVGASNLVGKSLVTERPMRPVNARVILVGDDEQAHFAALNDALQQANSGDVIRVVGTADQRGPIRFGEHLKPNITIEWQSSGWLAGEDGTALVEIHGIPSIRLQGIRIRTTTKQHGILIVGHCEGLIIERCQIEQPSMTHKAAILFWTDAHGSKERPLRLQRNMIHCGDIGIAAIAGGNTRVEQIVIEENRILGNGP